MRNTGGGSRKTNPLGFSLHKLAIFDRREGRRPRSSILTFCALTKIFDPGFLKTTGWIADELFRDKQKGSILHSCEVYGV